MGFSFFESGQRKRHYCFHPQNPSQFTEPRKPVGRLCSARDNDLSSTKTISSLSLPLENLSWFAGSLKFGGGLFRSSRDNDLSSTKITSSLLPSPDFIPESVVTANESSDTQSPPWPGSEAAETAPGIDSRGGIGQ